MKNTNRFFAFLLLLCALTLNCNTKEPEHVSPPAQSTASDSTQQTGKTTAAKEKVRPEDRKEVPILCYHRITNIGKIGDYTVSEDAFREQMKTLADSGYHSVLPDQLYDYLTNGTPLPSKPVMITFDDTRAEHATIARPVLEQHGFKGVFFLMTVSINRPNYMTTEQIKGLSDAGHAVESHTYDHQNMKKLPAEEYDRQVVKPTQKIESITGKPVRYFAYPFGLWNEQAVEGLKKYEVRAAFQLSEKKSTDNPLYSIRRIIVPGQWSTKTMMRSMKQTFKLI